MLYNPTTTDFFKHQEKAGETSTEQLLEMLPEIFNLVFLSHTKYDKKIERVSNLEEYNFFREIKEQITTPKILDSETSTCDEVFAEYILKVSKFVNKEFLARILRFVMLFRENLNNVYQQKNKQNSGKYSMNYNAEDAPDISNEFVTDYLVTDEHLFDFSKEEAIDLTQNFCQWLYDNNYTCSKLSLISANN